MPSAAGTVRPELQSAEAQAHSRLAARRKLWLLTGLAIVAGMVTASTFASSRISSHVHSGSPGYRMGKDGKPVRWRQPVISVYFDSSLDALGSGARDAVTRAFGRWIESDGQLPDLVFDTGQTSAVPVHDGKSTVSYGRISAPGHERDLAITVTYTDEASGRIVEADIVLNSAYPMGVLSPSAGDELTGDGHAQGNVQGKSKQDGAGDCRNRFDVQNVATHEIGHFFGLGEDPVERNATMFQTIDQCETHKRALRTTDVDALTALYAQAEEPEEDAPGAQSCAFAARPSPQASGWISVVVMLGLAGLCRRRSARC